jgi:hypothetical protein
LNRRKPAKPAILAWSTDHTAIIGRGMANSLKEVKAQLAENWRRPLAQATGACGECGASCGFEADCRLA